MTPIITIYTKFVLHARNVPTLIFTAAFRIGGNTATKSILAFTFGASFERIYTYMCMPMSYILVMFLFIGQYLRVCLTFARISMCLCNTQQVQRTVHIWLIGLVNTASIFYAQNFQINELIASEKLKNHTESVVREFK